MIPLSKQQPSSQDHIKTCSSLTEAECQRTKLELFRHNFSTLSEARLSQALSESLTRIDQCAESLLMTLPHSLKTMTVAELVSKYQTDVPIGDHRFEVPVKRTAIEERTSGEAVRRKVRQQLAATSTSQPLTLPGTRTFMELPSTERHNIISVLNAVVSTYSQVHRDADS